MKHWTLVVADFRRMRIEYYDSLTPDVELVRKVTGGLAKFIYARSNSQGKLVDMTTFHHIWEQEGIPRHKGFDECGVFMLTYASLLARGIRPPFSFTYNDITNICRRIALDTVVQR